MPKRSGIRRNQSAAADNLRRVSVHGSLRGPERDVAMAGWVLEEPDCRAKRFLRASLSEFWQAFVRDWGMSAAVLELSSGLIVI
jgi:hypothetical protein